MTPMERISTNETHEQDDRDRCSAGPVAALHPAEDVDGRDLGLVREVAAR